MSPWWQTLVGVQGFPSPTHPPEVVPALEEVLPVEMEVAPLEVPVEPAVELAVEAAVEVEDVPDVLPPEVDAVAEVPVVVGPAEVLPAVLAGPLELEVDEEAVDEVEVTEEDEEDEEELVAPCAEPPVVELLTSPDAPVPPLEAEA
jgi:hypothetical protein